MKPNKLTRAMIRAAVNKGLKDIKENPGRGVRGLLDLGGMFSSGSFQQEFFSHSTDVLKDRDSPYYRLASRAVQNTDTELLTNFGLNLGYNSFSHGARQIRLLEKSLGFNIPWTVLLDMESQSRPGTAEISDVVRQGRELGIYCYFLRLGDGYQELDRLMEALEAERDCAFILLLPAKSVTAELAKRIRKSGLYFVLFELDCAQEQRERAAAILRGEQCLYGVYSVYSGESLSYDKVLESAERLMAAACVFVRAEGVLSAPEERERFNKLRNTPSREIFPIDLYDDIALVDRNISSEACLAIITGDGQLTVTDMDERKIYRGFNIRETSLTAALESAMPKKKQAG